MTPKFRFSPFRAIAIAATSCAVCVFALQLSVLAQAVSRDTESPQHKGITKLLQDLSRTRAPLQPAISPDGRIVAWVAPAANTGERINLRTLNGNDASTQLISMPNSNPQVERSCSESNIAWSPDSKKIAFTSDCATPGQPQVFVSDVNSNSTETVSVGAAPRRLTSLKGFIHDVTWSPDGTQIGFLFVENATRPPGALAAMKPAVGVISAQTLAEIQRVAVIDVSPTDQTTPQVMQVTRSEEQTS